MVKIAQKLENAAKSILSAEQKQEYTVPNPRVLTDFQSVCATYLLVCQFNTLKQSSNFKQEKYQLTDNALVVPPTLFKLVKLFSRCLTKSSIVFHCSSFR